MERILTPQQELFLASYTNPKSDTFSNAKRSALKAGYSEEYSDNLTSLMPDWLSEYIGSMKMVLKAERNINQVQELPIVDEEGKIDNSTLANRNKVDMFVLERLNKAKYSVRQELTGPDGKELIPISEEDKTKLKALI